MSKERGTWGNENGLEAAFQPVPLRPARRRPGAVPPGDRRRVQRSTLSFPSQYPFGAIRSCAAPPGRIIG